MGIISEPDPFLVLSNNTEVLFVNIFLFSLKIDKTDRVDWWCTIELEARTANPPRRRRRVSEKGIRRRLQTLHVLHEELAAAAMRPMFIGGHAAAMERAIEDEDEDEEHRIGCTSAGPGPLRASHYPIYVYMPPFSLSPYHTHALRSPSAVGQPNSKLSSLATTTRPVGRSNSSARLTWRIQLRLSVEIKHTWAVSLSRSTATAP